MSRRKRATKRKIEPDPKYKSVTLAKFINKVMLDGKKSVAQRIVYKALDRFTAIIGEGDTLTNFLQALDNAKPTVEVRSRRVGGATYQVPMEISADRQESVVMRWVIQFAKAKPGVSMEVGLAGELVDCYRNEGATTKKRDDTHRMADANRAFAHFKW